MKDKYIESYRKATGNFWFVPHKEKCKCGNEITIMAQTADNPEYLINVGVKCQKCGNFMQFTLPVN